MRGMTKQAELEEARHGAIGDRLGYELVVAGTVVTGIAFSITVTLKS